MSEQGQDRAGRQGAPWHLWLVGIAGLLWDLVGAFDYLATQTEYEPYMSGFTPEQLDYFFGLPTWVVAFWALAVWGGVLGTLLLLLRKRLAAPVLLVSFVSMVITAFHNFLALQRTRDHGRHRCDVLRVDLPCLAGPLALRPRHGWAAGAGVGSGGRSGRSGQRLPRGGGAQNVGAACPA